MTHIRCNGFCGHIKSLQNSGYATECDQNNHNATHEHWHKRLAVLCVFARMKHVF